MFVNGATYNAQHPDHVLYMRKWTLIRDVLRGELAVKEKGPLYLPLQNVEKSIEAFNARYAVYLEKAKFYNATARTLAGFVGQVFNKQPAQEFDPSIQYLKDDPCGTGSNLEQLAKDVIADVMSYGRCGLWVDFPKTGGSYSMADVKEGLARPTITKYSAINIINWKTIKRGAKTLLSLVVLRERVLVDTEDEFVSRYDYQYRVLRLRDGVYSVKVFKVWSPDEEPEVIPLDNNGNPFDEIPFVFIGIKQNDSKVDNPPLYDMASLNIAHYRNSADYEEACFMVGQPTVWYAGLDQTWIDTVLKGEFRVGSRGGLPLPPGGSAGLLQVQSNTLCKEAMDQKEAQMIALGARIVRESSVAKTATEVNSDKVSEVSTLASGARNTSAGLRKAFDFAQKFAGSNAEVKFELSTDFDMTSMTSQMLLAIVATWQAGLMVSEDVHDVFTRAGFTNLTFEEAKAKGMADKPPEPMATNKPVAKSDNQASSANNSSSGVN